jgi:hypothetical protein
LSTDQKLQTFLKVFKFKFLLALQRPLIFVPVCRLSVNGVFVGGGGGVGSGGGGRG